MTYEIAQQIDDTWNASDDNTEVAGHETAAAAYVALTGDELAAAVVQAIVDNIGCHTVSQDKAGRWVADEALSIPWGGPTVRRFSGESLADLFVNVRAGDFEQEF